jgi:hypothetical protein
MAEADGPPPPPHTGGSLRRRADGFLWDGEGDALAALRSAEAGARAAALRWLGAHAPDVLGGEQEPLLRDPDLAVRTAATVVLRAAADPTVVNRARQALRDLVMGSLPERHAGLRAAAEIANPTLAPRLLHYLHDPDPETRRLTLLALAAVPPGLLGPDFLRPPAEAALNDPDAGVRAAAEMVLRAEGRGQRAE